MIVFSKLDCNYSLWLVSLRVFLIAICLFYSNVASLNPLNIITAWKFCIILIMTNYFIASKTTYLFSCNVAFLYWQRGAFSKDYKNSYVFFLFFIISLFTHYFTYIVYTNNIFPSFYLSIYITNYILY